MTGGGPMACTLYVAWDDRLAGYDFGVGHPMTSARVELTIELASGRWLLTGGGGYDLLQVVPRTWAHLLAEAAGHPIAPGARIPAAWREHASRGTGRLAPEFMTEGAPAGYVGFESGYDPADPIDQAILATRAAVFPEHGMMPLP